MAKNVSRGVHKTCNQCWTLLIDFDQPIFEGLQRVVLFLARRLQGGFADRVAEHLGAHLADPQTGALLGVVEISEQGAEVLTILDGGFDVGREGRHHGPMAAGALLDFRPMLGALQFQGRQVEYLAALKIQGGFAGEILATVSTLLQRLNLEVLGPVAEGERAAGMTGLAAGLAIGPFRQALGLGLLGSIRGGRSRAVATVLCGGVPQSPHLGLQLEGVIHQAAGIGLLPTPQLFPTLSDRGGGVHRL